MIDRIYELAQRPDCVMCVTPDAGGSWASGIRLDGTGPQPVMPRVAGASEAQRIGLLTPYNCRIADAFELDSDAVNNWYARTRLSFAGWSDPITILGRMHIAPDSGGSNAFDYEANVFHPLIAQGYPAGGIGPGLVLALYYTNQNGINQYRAALTLNTGSGVIMSATPSAPPQGMDVMIAVTINPITGRWSIYEDGVLCNSVVNASLVGLTLLSDTSNINNDTFLHLHQRLSSWQNRRDRIFCAAVLRGILTAGEIAYYCN